MIRYKWRTHTIDRHTPDTVTIHFDTGGSDFTYKPGQYINIYHVAGEGQVCRSYSLCSSPHLQERPSITVKRLEGGLVSNDINELAEKMSHWDIEGPFGNFLWEGADAPANPIVLIGGGSGIVPLWSIAKSALVSANASVYIFYASSSSADIIFHKEMLRYEREYAGRLTIHHFVSQNGGAASEVHDFKGRMSQQILAEMLHLELGTALQSTQYFLCGPDGLMNVAREALETLSVSQSQIHSEKFVTTATADDKAQLPDETFEVLVHSGIISGLVTVPPHTNILEAALKEGMSMSYSCMSGTCGKCAAKLLKGDVLMTQNYALTEEHLQAGYRLLCQSYPLNNEVTVDMD